MTTVTAKNRFMLWLAAIRPKTLLASLSPVLVGGACAGAAGFCNWPVWLVTALTAVLLQTVANLANDYFDYKHGYDVPGRQGPLRIMQNGLIKPAVFMRTVAGLSLVAVLLGLFLVWQGGWPILVIGIASLAFAFLYSAGPWPLAAHAMGEAASVVFFGLLAAGGAYYLQTHAINLTVLILSLIPGLLTACIMMINNYRDMEIDRRTGKTTLAVLVGAQSARLVYVAAILTAYIIAALAALFLPGVSRWALLIFLSLPLAVKVMRDIYRKQGAGLNQTLAQTALLDFGASLLLSIGLLL